MAYYYAEDGAAAGPGGEGPDSRWLLPFPRAHLHGTPPAPHSCTPAHLYPYYYAPAPLCSYTPVPPYIPLYSITGC